MARHQETNPASEAEADTMGKTVAATLEPMLSALLAGEPPVRIEFWDGSAVGVEDGPGTLRMTSPDAMRRIMWSPDELGFARAFVFGDIEVEGPVADVLIALQKGSIADGKVAIAAAPKVLAAARELGVMKGPRPEPPPEELIPRGIRHSVRRDKETVSHHYDVGNDFYRLVLGPSMTYSCARFVSMDNSLEEAQASKHEMICRKVGLTDDAFRSACPGDRPRLLDVGCGWGSMAMHAAAEHDVDVVGITISDEQAAEARRRVEEAGLSERVEIRIQDYREIADGPYDAISSIGMAEHVGLKNLATYFEQMHGLLRPGGRMMNHAIASVGGSKLGRRQFVYRYVFPDGELIDVGKSAIVMQQAGFELRDVEGLREHYAETLRRWVANLEANWDVAVELVGARRARVWQLYMSGSMNGFRDGGLQINQTLGVKHFPDGRSGMATTRAGWI